MNITNFTILGERCSGTNFLEEAMVTNFNMSYNAVYGNKHFFCLNPYPTDKQLTNNTLFIGIIRNPIYWLNSFSKELYHIPDVNKKNLSVFLFNEFYSVLQNDTNNNNNNKNNTFMSTTFNKTDKINVRDLNYITGKKYKNIFEMRKLKNYFLMNIMPLKVDNYILINYEDLLYNYEITLQKMKDKFSLQVKNDSDSFIKIAKYKKSDKYQFVKQREISFTPQVVDLLWQHLDMEQEKKLGYFPTSHNDNNTNTNDTKNNTNTNDDTKIIHPMEDNIPLKDG